MDSRKGPRPGTGFRPDIEGMRAVAIVAVLLCHAGVPAVAGVDVFFVISGFLITRLLLGELERTGRISLRGFYARRAKRLLPLSAILLVVVAVLSLLLLSPLRGLEVSGDIVSSALYVANWHFAAQSADYFSQTIEPSPVLHLWSLAIEEQFYLVWPALMLAVTWLWRRRGRSIRPALWTAVAVVFAASLALGIASTASQPEIAYFSTFGRAWELALGAVLALLGAVRIWRSAAAVLGWAGLAAIVYASLAFDATTPFPGTAALLPTLGTAALILAGSSLYAETGGAPAALLSLAPVRYVGRISYSWYLWHWPALVFAAVLWGPLSPLAGLGVVAAAAIPTALTHHLVEDPVRRAKSLARMPNRALALGLACTALALGSGIMLTDLQPVLRTAPADAVVGAAALVHQPDPQQRADAGLRPNPLRARDDHPRAFREGCLVGIEGTNSNRCLYGAVDGELTLVLFGDSHAMQYFPALETVAKRLDRRLIVLTKAECTPGEVRVHSRVIDREYQQCATWREDALRRIEAATGGSTVVMAGSASYRPYDDGGRKLSGAEAARALQGGYSATLERIARAGMRTAVLRDLPFADSDIPSCVSDRLDDLQSCAFEWVRHPDREFDVRAARAAPATHVIDLTPQICPGGLCRAVIGNALVFRDDSHLTATFARTLSPWIEAGLLGPLSPRLARR